MQSTVVECTLISKKETQSYNPKQPIQTEMVFQIPYNQADIYYQQSGGTGLTLMTINQEAADQFKLGDKVRVTISKVEVPAIEEPEIFESNKG